MKCSIRGLGSFAGSDDLTDAQIMMVDAIETSRCITADKVVETLQSTIRVGLPSEAFIGRPITQITATDHYVIKWRTDYRLKETDSLRFIAQRLVQERRLQFYHPCKTWFYLQKADQVVIANITPRLTPLHLASRTASADQMMEALRTLLDRYLRIAKHLSIRLDEGLSNYGLDVDNNLYYLDDDHYDWDRFTALSQSIGVWLRQLTTFSDTQTEQLGQALREALVQHFADTHWIDVITRQVGDLFYANDAQQARKAGFLKGLAVPKATHQVFQAVLVRTQPLTASRVAVLADIHANYPALKVVLDQLDAWGIQEGIVLGDVVGYGPHPCECIHALQQRPFLVIKGNHDHALATTVPERGFSSLGRWVLEWSTHQLDDSQRQWLAALPAYHRQDNWLAVHGAPQDKTFFNAYVYQTTYEENLDYLAEQQLTFCLHGHSHIQGIYYRHGTRHGFMRLEELNIATLSYGLICPGSVGQPRSHQAGAEFAIFDREAGQFHFYRLAYDLEQTMEAMRQHHFPATLIERLPKGQ